jgi:hypothetical protein
MSDRYALVGNDTLERLWPESETRPERAWVHADCGLIVTNRVDHSPGDWVSRYPCPSPAEVT